MDRDLDEQWSSWNTSLLLCKKQNNSHYFSVFILLGLTPRVDDTFLLKFLRPKKFDQERTFHLIINYYQMKKDNEDLFAQMTPVATRHVIDSNVSCVLPGKGRCGETFIVFRTGTDHHHHHHHHHRIVFSGQASPTCIGLSTLSSSSSDKYYNSCINQYDRCIRLRFYCGQYWFLLSSANWDPDKISLEDLYQNIFLLMSALIQVTTTIVSHLLDNQFKLF